jgi:hypothetical protein
MPLRGNRFAGPLSGGEVSSIGWAYEDALKSYRECHTPEILMYRKAAEPTIGLGDLGAAREWLDQNQPAAHFLGGRSFLLGDRIESTALDVLKGLVEAITRATAAGFLRR